MTLFRLVAISSISDAQLLTPGRKGQKIAKKASEPPSQWRFNSFSIFSPPLEQCVLWKGPYAAMGGVMIRFTMSVYVCVVRHFCFLENHLDYFHLISPHTHLGKAIGTLLRIDVFIAPRAYVPSCVFFFSMWVGKGRGRKKNDFEGEKGRRQRLRSRGNSTNTGNCGPLELVWYHCHHFLLQRRNCPCCGNQYRLKQEGTRRVRSSATA